jgi:hypothetical protein
MLGEKSRDKPDESFRLLEEFELSQKSPGGGAHRAVETFQARTSCQLRPGNLSERDRFVAEGGTRQVTRTGVVAVFPRPVAVGDVYHLTFDRKALDLPTSFVQCTMCRLLHDGAFEATLAFFVTVEMPQGLQVG